MTRCRVLAAPRRAMVTIAAIRLAAIVWPIELPVYELERAEQPDASRRTID